MQPPHDQPVVRLDRSDRSLHGPNVHRSQKTITQLAGVFADEAARAAIPPQTTVYSVIMHTPVAPGTAGGLFFGTSIVEPGLVGDEYFMTRGHLHARREAGEYYWHIQGRGLLLLMDEARRTAVREVDSASLHYIPGHTAHRLVNTGDDRLIVGACWPADAGYDYASIERDGFSVRIRRIDGRPTVVPVD